MQILDIFDSESSLMLISFENSNSASLLKLQMLSYALLLYKMLMDTTSSDLDEHYFHQENLLYLSEFVNYRNLVLLNWMLFFFRLKFYDFNLWALLYVAEINDKITKVIKWFVIFCCVVTSFSRYVIFFDNTFRIWNDATMKETNSVRELWCQSSSPEGRNAAHDVNPILSDVAEPSI